MALALAQPQTPVDIGQLLAQARDPMQTVYLIGSMLSLDLAKEQALLEAPTKGEALRLLHGYLSHELQILELRHKIASQAQTEMTKEQRDYFLRQHKQLTDDGPLDGSWDPVHTGEISEVLGGRMLRTCLAVLTLEVYYRQVPLHLRDGL